MHTAEQLASDLLRRDRFGGREAHVGGARARFKREGTHCKSYARRGTQERIPTTTIHAHLLYAVPSLEAYATKDARDIEAFFFFLEKTVTNKDLADVASSSGEWCCSLTKPIACHSDQQRSMPYFSVPLLERPPTAPLGRATSAQIILFFKYSSYLAYVKHLPPSRTHAKEMGRPISLTCSPDPGASVDGWNYPHQRTSELAWLRR